MKPFAFFLFSTLILFSACKGRKVEHFNLVLVATYDPSLKEGDKLPALYQDLFSGYVSDSFPEVVYLPDVTVKRLDAHPDREEKLAFDDGGLMGDAAAARTKGLASMTIPKILSDKISGSANMIIPGNAIVLDAHAGDHLAALKSDLATKLFRKRLTGDLMVCFPTENTPSAASGQGNAQLEVIFQKLMNTKLSPDTRMTMIPELVGTAFAQDATIQAYNPNGTRAGNGSVSDYFNKLIGNPAITKVEVFGIKTTDDGKFWEVSVMEHKDTPNH
jgi:hypothetical protein